MYDIRICNFGCLTVTLKLYIRC